ncbi:MAG: hypothetical protein ACT4OX_15200 [Actinomycetota bacterium]
MQLLSRIEATTGPVAVEGRTLTLVSRARALRVGGRHAAVFRVEARPSHVEVLNGDGTRDVVAIRDVQRTVTRAIVLGTAAAVIGARVAQHARGQR